MAQVLDSHEVAQLGQLLGIDMDSKSIDAVMMEILNPGGTKKIEEADMLVNFDEFFSWYITQQEGATGGWDALRRAFDAAKGFRDAQRSQVRLTSTLSLAAHFLMHI